MLLLSYSGLFEDSCVQPALQQLRKCMTSVHKVKVLWEFSYGTAWHASTVCRIRYGIVSVQVHAMLKQEQYGANQLHAVLVLTCLMTCIPPIKCLTQLCMNRIGASFSQRLKIT